MDREFAEEHVLNNLAKWPEKHKTDFEALYLNEHFGDVITEVFPEVLDPSSENGQYTLHTYAVIARFLESTKDAEDSSFLAYKIQAKHVPANMNKPFLQVQAMSLYYYSKLRAEHFEVTRDPEGLAVGVAVNHQAKVYREGFHEPDRFEIAQYAVIDSRVSMSSRVDLGVDKPSEQSLPMFFTYGNSLFDVAAKLNKTGGDGRTWVSSINHPAADVLMTTFD